MKFTVTEYEAESAHTIVKRPVIEKIQDAATGDTITSRETTKQARSTFDNPADAAAAMVKGYAAGHHVLVTDGSKRQLDQVEQTALVIQLIEIVMRPSEDIGRLASENCPEVPEAYR